MKEKEKKLKSRHEFEGTSGECIFCKVLSGEVESAAIYEDKKYLAILDLFPNCEGMTVLIPKKHAGSDVFDMEDREYIELMKTSKKIAKKLEKGLGVKRVAMVCEGMGIDHMHVKLYPLHGLKSKFVESWADKNIYFKKYEGYVTTLLGPKAEMKKLKELAKKIKRGGR